MRLGFFIDNLNRKGGTEITLVNRLNYLAEKNDYKIYLFVKEKKKVFDLHQNINILNIKDYTITKIQDLINNLNLDLITSLNREEVNYLTDLNISCKKILEYHTSKNFFEKIYYDTRYQKNLLKKLIMKIFGYIKIKELEKKSNKFDKVILLTKQDLKSWKIKNKIQISNALREFPKETSKLENKIILSVGRLSKEKGFDRLIDVMELVFRKHKDWKLEIYGEGNEKEKLENKIKKLKLNSNIEIFPFEKDILKKYLNSSIYVLPSYVEGQGMVLLEAMSCGVPMVSFDIKCGPRDIISNNYNGYIVKDGNITLMSNRIIDLIEKEDLRKTMGQNARQMSHLYKKENIMKKWTDLYEDLVRSDKN